MTSHVGLSLIFTTNLLTTTITMGIPMLLSTLQAVNAGVDPFESVSLSGIGYISAISATLVGAAAMTKREKPSKEASYFMELQRAFGPDESPHLRLHNYSRVMEEFIND